VGIARSALAARGQGPSPLRRTEEDLPPSSAVAKGQRQACVHAETAEQCGIDAGARLGPARVVAPPSLTSDPHGTVAVADRAQQHEEEEEHARGKADV
jgi:hypothetical protein